MVKKLNSLNFLDIVVPESSVSKVSEIEDLDQRKHIMRTEAFECMKRFYNISDIVLAGEAVSDEITGNDMRRYWELVLAKTRLLVLLSIQVHHSVEGDYRQGRYKGREDLVKALLILHGKACQVSNEIIVLVSNGYSSGALARWRTLFEINVFSKLLMKYGNELAHRFLEYRKMDLCGLYLDSYPSFAERLGLRKLDDTEVQKYKDVKIKLMKDFDEKFVQNNGWAKTVERNTKFTNLADKAGLGDLKFLYEFTSLHIHPGAVSTVIDFGVPETARDKILLGPSVHGVYYPSHLMVIMMTDITKNLLEIDDSPRGLLLSQFAQVLLADVGEELRRRQDEYVAIEDTWKD